jgi:hypothetical protein
MILTKSIQSPRVRHSRETRLTWRTVNPYLKFFIAVLPGTALMIGFLHAFPNAGNYSFLALILAIAPSMVILWSNRSKLRPLVLLTIALACFGISYALFLVAKPAPREIGVSAVITEFALLTLLSLLLHAAVVNVLRVVRYCVGAARRA